MDYYQSRAEHFLRIDTANTLKIAKQPQKMRPDFPEYKKLQECGREWLVFELAEMATGFVRFGTPQTMRGRFLTNICPATTGEAQEILELAVSSNAATHKCKVDAPRGTVISAGLMTSSKTIQFYVPNTANLTYYEPTLADWKR